MYAWLAAWQGKSCGEVSGSEARRGEASRGETRRGASEPIQRGKRREEGEERGVALSEERYGPGRRW